MHAKDLYDRLAAGYNYDPMYGELCNERDRLKIENAKLREYAIAAGRCGDYRDCRSYNGGMEEFCPMLTEDGMCRLEEMARELRIGA